MNEALLKMKMAYDRLPANNKMFDTIGDGSASEYYYKNLYKSQAVLSATHPHKIAY
jgi:hypothetical protein